MLELASLDPIKFPRVHKVLKEALGDEVAPGFVAGFWSHKEPGLYRAGAFGQRRLLPATQPMEVNTIFDFASVTKVFATATLAAVLVERGWVDWDTPITSIIREYPYPKIKLRHLLSHTAGLPWWKPLWQNLRESYSYPIERVSIETRQKDMRALVYGIAPEAEPDLQTVYSDITFLLLGFALEELTQMPLDQAVKKFLWDPMGVRSAYYQRVFQATPSMFKSDLKNEKVAATESCPWRGVILQGQVHDDNCWAMGGYSGHAGAFGTIEDLMQFSSRMLRGFLSQKILQAAWSRVDQPVGCTRTLGWDTPSGPEPSAGKLFSSQSVGHLGFTGTSLWIDPRDGLAVALLSNRVHPSRENIKIRALRPKFHEALKQDLA